MILPDANLLIYAVNRDAPLHAPARAWLELELSGTEPIALVWMVLLAFIRITTNPRIFARPLATERALEYVDGWLRQPCVRPLSPGEKHWMIFERLLRTSGSAGNLANDAHLAAIAIEHGCTLYSADHDFQRFVGLDFVDPLNTEQVHER